MKVNLETRYQLFLFLEEEKKSMYDTIHQRAQEGRYVRWTAPFIAIGGGALDLAQAVSLVGEPIVKGVGNIISAACGGDGRCIRGIKMLTESTPFGLFSFPFYLIKAIIFIPTSFLGTLIDPKGFTHYMSDLCEKPIKSMSRP